MRESQYSISLARIAELPEVLKAYQAYKQKVNEIQTARIEARVAILVREVLTEIETIDIPINPGQRLLYLFEVVSPLNDEIEALALEKTPPSHQRGPAHGSLLNANVRDGVEEDLVQDFDSHRINTARIYRRLVDELRKVFRTKFPAGNVKLSVKREKTIKVPAKQTFPDVGEIDVLEEHIVPRHTVITVAIPTTPPPSPKSTPSKRASPVKRKAKAKAKGNRA